MQNWADLSSRLQAFATLVKELHGSHEDKQQQLQLASAVAHELATDAAYAACRTLQQAADLILDTKVGASGCSRCWHTGICGGLMAIICLAPPSFFADVSLPAAVGAKWPRLMQNVHSNQSDNTTAAPLF